MSNSLRPVNNLFIRISLLMSAKIGTIDPNPVFGCKAQDSCAEASGLQDESRADTETEVGKQHEENG
ncbi:MAG: hypothetical protein LUF30_02710 [Lachnospiraceae bacterium]|nr:hypothetical protein [Lachnospiraceae bacterium]